MNERILKGALLAAVLALPAAGPALAGPADSAVPSISVSAATRVLYTVPGVIKNNGLESAIMCTNMDTTDVTVALEVFAPEGGAALNNVASAVGNGAITLPIGATGTISTGTSVGLHEDEPITGLANVKNGSGRILATSTRVLCTGILVEKLGSTPNTIATLKIFAQRRQNGD